MTDSAKEARVDGMKERPIIFSPPMVRAILAGRKTQTRRIVRPQPVSGDWHYDEVYGALLRHDAEGIIRCPYGIEEGRLWVRESMRFDMDQGWRYEADGADIVDGDFGYSRPFCPSIHMPRTASRITLELILVRVEQVQTISEQDARDEGAEPYHTNSRADYYTGFMNLWESINAARAPWASNPFVWVLEFRRIEQ